MKWAAPITGACVAFVTLALAGCSQDEAARPASTPNPSLVGEEGCPASLPNVATLYAESPDGMQVDFIGPPEEVRAIRGRVRRLTKHGELALSQACPCSSVQTAQGGTEQTLAPAADARADDLPNGGRVFFAARDRDDIVLLRAHLRRYVDMIQAGRCGKEYPEVNPPKQP